MIDEKQLQLDINNIKERRRGLILLFKPGEDDVYSDVINMLDEALTNNVIKYVVLKPAVEEIKWMDKNKEKIKKLYCQLYEKGSTG